MVIQHFRSIHGLIAVLAVASLAVSACTANSGGGAGGPAAVSADAVTTGASASGGSGFANKDAASNTDPDAAASDVPVVKTFSPNIGLSCAGEVACPTDGSVDCYGNVESPSAICTVACNTDTDCPAAFACKGPAGNRACQPRTFCSTCTEDAQCGAGSRCVTMGDAKFCSRDCTKKTGCPRYAQCQEVDEGGMACVHTSGTCQGDGSLCSACAATGDCGSGGTCLTFNYTGEQFCATPCDGNSCATSYSCVKVSTADGPTPECVPADKNAPKCVSSLHGTMEVGDIMEDFEMVGFEDTDQDGQMLKLADGSPEIAHRIRLSEYAAMGGYKVIIFVVAAGWCGPCQQETTTNKKLMASYPNVGIFQVLFDGATQNTPAKMALTKSWIKNLNAVGAVGADFEKRVVPINTAGSVPLNIIIDAQTRKILLKMNGAPPGGMGSVVAKYAK